MLRGWWRQYRAALALAVTLCLLAAGVATTATGATAGGGIITTVAGNGTFGFSGDGGPATAAEVGSSFDVAALPDGGFLIADCSFHRIRRVSPAGIINTVAGNGTNGYSGDGGPATAAALGCPTGVALTPDGGFLIAEEDNAVIRRVSPAGIITTVAGTAFSPGLSGDGGPATAAQLSTPYAAAPTADGGFLIADSNNNRIRRVSAAGIITTVAGNGTIGFSGDGGPAAAAQLDSPFAVAATADGGFLIADSSNSRIRRVSPAGIITTVAGTAPGGPSTGDGGPATAAQISSPQGVAATADGGFVFSDTGNDRVRRVSPAGIITTVAGDGITGYSGDGGPATAASLFSPRGVAQTADGGFLIADISNNRIRRVSPPAPVLGKAVNVKPVSGHVLIKVNGKFVPLTGASQIPVGSTLDTTRGTVLLTAAKDRKGHTATGRFHAGIFRITQKRKGKTAITLLTLTGPKPTGCAPFHAAPDATTARRRRRRRRRSLWGSASGGFGTVGSYASGAERGTTWLTQDSCAGTLIKVTQGAVLVTDFPHHRTFLLRAPHSFLAHPGKGG